MKLLKIAAAVAILVACAPKAIAQERGHIAALADCRANPSEQGKFIERLSKGDPVTIIGNQEAWSKILSASGNECWVPSEKIAGWSAYTSTGAPSGKASAKRSTAKRTSKPMPARSSSANRSPAPYYGSNCPCSGSRVCIGPRGGRYCITSGGNKRYGV